MEKRLKKIFLRILSTMYLVASGFTVGFGFADNNKYIFGIGILLLMFHLFLENKHKL